MPRLFLGTRNTKALVARLRADTRSAVHCAMSEEAADEIERLEAALAQCSERIAEAEQKNIDWAKGNLVHTREKLATDIRFLKLADEIERCEHGHMLIDIAKAIRNVVSASAEGSK